MRVSSPGSGAGWVGAPGPAAIAGFFLIVLAAWTGSAFAAERRDGLPTLIVADFELVQTAPADERYDVAADSRRIRLVSREARRICARSTFYRLLDRGREDQSPPYSYLSCHACIWDWAHARGADFVLVGWVQKVSRLILLVGVALLDVKREEVMKEETVSIRDDTDRMWLEATDYVLNRTILARTTERRALHLAGERQAE